MDLNPHDERYPNQNVSDLLNSLLRPVIRMLIGLLHENIFWKNRDVGFAVAFYFVGFLNKILAVLDATSLIKKLEVF